MYSERNNSTGGRYKLADPGHWAELDNYVPCAIFALCPSLRHLKIKRAKAFVDDAGIKVLTECDRCGKEKYIVEGQKVCDEWGAHSKRKRKRAG